MSQMCYQSKKKTSKTSCRKWFWLKHFPWNRFVQSEYVHVQVFSTLKGQTRIRSIELRKLLWVEKRWHSAKCAFVCTFLTFLNGSRKRLLFLFTEENSFHPHLWFSNEKQIGFTAEFHYLFFFSRIKYKAANGQVGMIIFYKIFESIYHLQSGFILDSWVRLEAAHKFSIQLNLWIYRWYCWHDNLSLSTLCQSQRKALWKMLKHTWKGKEGKG